MIMFCLQEFCSPRQVATGVGCIIAGHYSDNVVLKSLSNLSVIVQDVCTCTNNQSFRFNMDVSCITYVPQFLLYSMNLAVCKSKALAFASH